MKMRESLIDSAAPAAPVAPIISDWRNLDAGARRALLARPAVPENTDLEQRVARILAQVGRGGDGALRDLTRQHDGCDLQALEVEARDLDAADTQLPAELKEAIRASALRIAAFHNAAAGRAVRVETAAGVVCERRSEEHTSELQSRGHLVCRLLLEKKNKIFHVITFVRVE